MNFKSLIFMVSCLFTSLHAMDNQLERSRSGSSPLSFLRNMISSPRIHKSYLKNSSNYSDIDSIKICEQESAAHEGLSRHVYFVNRGVSKGLITREQANMMINGYKFDNGIIDR